MPMYEYDCPDCGQSFEKRVTIAEANQTPCPHCGSTHTKRRLSRINVKGLAQTDGNRIRLAAPGST